MSGMTPATRGNIQPFHCQGCDGTAIMVRGRVRVRHYHWCMLLEYLQRVHPRLDARGYDYRYPDRGRGYWVEVPCSVG